MQICITVGHLGYIFLVHFLISEKRKTLITSNDEKKKPTVMFIGVSKKGSFNFSNLKVSYNPHGNIFLLVLSIFL